MTAENPETDFEYSDDREDFDACGCSSASDLLLEGICVSDVSRESLH